MHKRIRQHAIYFSDKGFIYTTTVAFCMLLISLIFQYYVGQYATEIASNSVTDIILSNIPVFDVDLIFVYGSIIFWIFVALLCLMEPKWIPFTAKSVALFVFIRSIFVSLTHLGPFPTQIPLTHSNIFTIFSFGGDLFFSGHTGLPFLMALIFWNSPWLRAFFIFSSITFGIVVLMGHLHYSIDVLAAFFITYTIFQIAIYLFKKDRSLFVSGLKSQDIINN